LDHSKSEIFQSIKDKIIDSDTFVFLTGAEYPKKVEYPPFVDLKDYGENMIL